MIAFLIGLFLGIALVCGLVYLLIKVNYISFEMSDKFKANFGIFYKNDN